MPNFKKYNYDQTAMVVINFEEQLQPNTFEYTLHHLIDNNIDLSAFYDKYHNDAGGRTAYDPAILLKIILFAYSKGITSSREIQWQCEHNILFKALSCDSVPHFTSIASFVSSYPDAIEDVFGQVLLVCSEQGLLGNELFAIEGRYRRAGISESILKDQVIITADTGFSNEANDEYLQREAINAYIPDNQFRSRDKKFNKQKEKYGKRHQGTAKGIKKVIPSSDFTFNLKKKTCRCPAGNDLWLKNETLSGSGKQKLFLQPRYKLLWP